MTNLTLKPIMWRRIGAEADARTPFAYDVVGLPTNETAKIYEDETKGWYVLRTHGGQGFERLEWFTTADDALTALELQVASAR
ncbi:MAG TPA: hypothetical protein VFO19_23590 [Vicinamibacterales bacterium]|jgi:hypothetical protein|nr:hypothetical protein [Vicinamibacterales bacterium]